MLEHIYDILVGIVVVSVKLYKQKYGKKDTNIKEKEG